MALSSSCVLKSAKVCLTMEIFAIFFEFCFLYNLAFQLCLLSQCYLRSCCGGKFHWNVPCLFDSHLNSLNGLGIFMIPHRHTWRPPLKLWHLVSFLLRVLYSDLNVSFSISQIFSTIRGVFSMKEVGEKEEVEEFREGRKAGRPTLML